MMRVVAVLALLAQPVAAECFVGQPHKVTFSDGKVMQVLDRQGDEVTFVWQDQPDSIRLSHLMMFHLETRVGDKVSRDRWTGRLPKSGDLVAGFHFAVQGSFTGTNGKTYHTRLDGTVVGTDTVSVGQCAYETTVIRQDYYVDGEWAYFTTDYLRTDMMVVLLSEIQPGGAKAIARVVTALQ